MATATITPSGSVIHNCDTAATWSGTAGTLDAELLKQGTNSNSLTIRTVGVNNRLITIASANMSTGHLRLWFNNTASKFMDTKANGGIRLAISDGTNTGYWYVGGKDTYGGGWVLLTVDTARAFDAGSCTKTAVTSVGFAINYLSAPKNAVNTWLDYLTYGGPAVVIGGTSGDPLNWEAVYLADVTAGYGFVQKINSVYFVNTGLEFGAATGDTYFSDTNQVVMFTNDPVSATLYKLSAVGGAANTISWKMYDSVIKSAGERFAFDFNDTNLDTFEMTGCTLGHAGLSYFKSGQNIQNNVFGDCSQITPSTATFQNNTVTKSVETTGALLWPDSQNTKNNNFLSNNRAVQFNTTTTPKDFDNMKFSGNTFDINNTSGSAITLNLNNGSNAASYTGTLVTFVNSKSFTIKGIPSGAEYRIYEDSTTAGTLGTVELQGSESWTGGDVVYSYTYTTDKNIILQVIHAGYVELLHYDKLENGNKTITITLTPDSNI